MNANHLIESEAGALLPDNEVEEERGGAWARAGYRWRNAADPWRARAGGGAWGSFESCYLYAEAAEKERRFLSQVKRETRREDIILRRKTKLNPYRFFLNFLYTEPWIISKYSKLVPKLC